MADGISFDTNIDLSPLLSALSEDQERHVTAVLTEKVGNDCNQYCPQDSGDLMRSIIKDVSAGVVRWPLDYAVYPFNASHVRKHPNPLAQPHWPLYAAGLHMDQWVDLGNRTIMAGFRD